MIRVTILENNIYNELWLKLMLIMTYIKNYWSIKAFQNFNPYETHFKKRLNLSYL